MPNEVSAPTMTIRELEEALLAVYPAQDAAEWDHTGLQVGDPAASVEKIAVALDPTVEAIRAARAQGCNVLVTHHPPYLSAPDTFVPADSVAIANGAGVYEAIRSDVALLCFHTALDFNPRGYTLVPTLVGLEPTGLLEPMPGVATENGYGCVCAPAGGKAMRLGDLAARCREALGAPVQVWGDADREVVRIASGQGSAGSLAQECIAQGIECLICGEIKYHAALDLSQAGVSLIVLGHDVSERPFVGVLADTLREVGIPSEAIEYIQQPNWFVS